MPDWDDDWNDPHCSVTWNGTVFWIRCAGRTAGGVLGEFLAKHPSLAGHGLALFSEVGIELDPDSKVGAWDDLILQPRVVH